MREIFDQLYEKIIIHQASLPSDHSLYIDVYGGEETTTLKLTELECISDELVQFSGYSLKKYVEVVQHLTQLNYSAIRAQVIHRTASTPFVNLTNKLFHGSYRDVTIRLWMVF